MVGNYRIAKDIHKSLYDDKVAMKRTIFTKVVQLLACDFQGRQHATLYRQIFSFVGFF